MPYHDPQGPPGPDGATAVLIPLAKLSFEQLWHFLQIEYPEQWDTLPMDRDWTTIGQFYSYIRCLLRTSFLTDEDFRHGPADHAIQPYNYSPNNVDTVYPSGKFDPGSRRRRRRRRAGRSRIPSRAAPRRQSIPTIPTAMPDRPS